MTTDKPAPGEHVETWQTRRIADLERRVERLRGSLERIRDYQAPPSNVAVPNEITPQYLAWAALQFDKYGTDPT